ncbi:helix-turn-helix domain-containing protein [Xylanimonas allomyrinae]|uniref:Helix-turn-helix domain-containing protein n=1 Tax=Xylanimonas allomyrinae TaxID=2509459 RepID=A0A4P6EMQ0_9MICO|nr:helix-turn-helix domain-containing protein [Xylanimonas allomyrinae]QAY63715.1 helix-turn-helix domain-containing protein [Xylanimonas allomyrinae]
MSFTYAPPSGAVAPLQRIGSFADFQATVDRSFVPLKVSSQRAHHFSAAVRAATLRGFSLVEIAAVPHVVERTRKLLGETTTEPAYKASLMLEGTGYICQDGHDVVLKPGDVAVYDTTRPYTLVFDDHMRTIVAMFPKRLVDLADDRVARLTATALGRDDTLGEMVGSVLAQLAGRLQLVTASTGWRLARNAVDLVTILLRDQLGEERTGLPAERLENVLAYIEAHLGDPDLSPTTIADAHYISVRSLHLLFKHTEVSVSSYIRTRRLERCRTDLADPALAGETVAGIATRWSFADAAHFSRTFKATYGETPSEFRARLR